MSTLPLSQRLKCLIVDDLEQNLLTLSAVLRRDDVDVLTARSGAEALEACLEHDVAVAFVDVQMPEMDGFELAELMRGSARTRHVPIIFVTAASREPSRAFRGYHLGAVDFLYKPIDPLLLESKAAVFFELHRHRLALAEELRQRSEMLRLNEMFTAVLSHDLRSPLHAILTGAFALQARSGDAEIQKIAGRIRSSGTRMSRMIEDLLDLTRARLAGGIPLRRAPANLGIEVERVLQEARSAHPTRVVQLRAAGDLAGEWDGDRVQQILANLVGNAIQHGTPGDPIAISLDGADLQQVRVSVMNGGVIPPDVLPTIFDPFHGRHGQGEGLGLGLYIAQQIAEAHGGRIHVDSRPGTGTVFTMTLPRSGAEVVRP